MSAILRGRTPHRSLVEPSNSTPATRKYRRELEIRSASAHPVYGGQNEMSETTPDRLPGQEPDKEVEGMVGAEER